MNILQNLAITIFLFFLLPLYSFSQNVSFEITSSTAGAFPYTLTAVPTSELPEGTKFLWDFGNGRLSDRQDMVEYTYPDNTPLGFYYVMLYVVDSLNSNIKIDSSEAQVIEIYAPPVVTYSMNKNRICKNNSVSFTPVVLDAKYPIIEYFWDFGDGKTGEGGNPTHLYEFGTTTEDQTILYPILTAVDINNATYTMPADSALPLTVILQNAPVPRINFERENELKYETFCGDIFTDTFIYQNLAFEDDVSTFHWIVNGDTVSTSHDSIMISLTADPRSSHTENVISLIAETSSGCVSDLITEQIILSVPKPEIIVADTAGVSRVFNGDTVCKGTFLVGTSDWTEYRWDFNNDGEFDSGNFELKDTIIDFSSPGEKNIKLEVEDYADCIGTDSISFFVLDDIYTSVTFDKDGYCKPTELQLVVESNMENVTHYTITPLGDTIQGDTIIQFLEQGTHTYRSWAVSASGCRSMFAQKTFYVDTPAITITDVKRYASCAPFEVTFNNLIEYDPDGFDDSITDVWIVLEGDTIKITDSIRVTHMYADSGLYEPTVIAETKLGCVYEDKAVEIFVGIPPIIDYQVPEDTICAFDGAPVIYATNLGGAYDTLWISFYDAEGRGLTKMVVGPATAEDEIQMLGWDTIGVHRSIIRGSNMGCRNDTAIDHELVVEGPIVRIGVTRDCDEPYTNFDLFLTKNLAAMDWDWSINAVELSNKHNVDSFPHIFPAPSDYLVSVFATNDTTQCEYRDETTISVRDLHVVYQPEDSVACAGSNFEIKASDLQNSSTGVADEIIIFDWILKTPSDYIYTGSVDNYQEENESPELIPVPEKGDYKLTVIAYDPQGCPSSDSISIRAYKPDAQMQLSNAVGCSPLRVTLTDISNATSPDTTIIYSRWYVNNLPIANVSPYTYTVDNYDTLYVKLEVEDALGCTDLDEGADKFIAPVKPLAYASTNPLICKDADSVLFHFPIYDLVDDAIWDFGNGAVHIMEPQFYQSFENIPEGDRDVILTTFKESPYGMCSTSVVIPVQVRDIRADIIIDDTDIKSTRCRSNSTWYYFQNGIDYAQNRNIEYNWHYQGEVVGTDYEYQQIVYEGNQQIKLKLLTDYQGCREVWDSMDVYYGKITPYIIAPDSICVNESVEFVIGPVENAEILKNWGFEWDFGDGYQIEDVVDPSHVFTNVKQQFDFLVQLIPNNDFIDCIELQDDLTRVPKHKVNLFDIMADFSINDEPDLVIYEQCEPVKVSFNNTSLGSLTQQWSVENGFTSTEFQIDSVLFDVPGTYGVTLSIVGDRCNDQLTKYVVVHPNPIINPMPDVDVLCRDRTIGINLNNESDNIEVTWSPLESLDVTNPFAPVAFPDSTQMYYVNVTENEYNCTITDSVKVLVQQPSEYFGAPVNWLVRMPISDTLEGISGDTLFVNEVYNINNDSLPGVSYWWEPSTGLSCDYCASPNVSLTDNQEYLLTMRDSNSCFIDTLYINFVVIKDSRLKVTTAFTPNGDSMNDFAFARGWGLKEFHYLRIYNRWGQLMFETSNFFHGWDGNYKGVPQNADTYSFVAEGIDHTGTTIVEKGYVTLIR